MPFLFYYKSPNEWIDVGEPPPYPDEIEYVLPPGVKPPPPVVALPPVMEMPKKPEYDEDDDLLVLLMKLEKYDD